MNKDHLNLKEQYMPVLYKQSTDLDLEISEQDIKQLQRSKLNIGIYPIYTFIGSFALANCLRYVNLPQIFSNPLVTYESVMLRQRFFKYFMSNQIIFIGVLGGFCLGFAKYEFTKYYLYLKYRRLVHSYLDSCEENFLINLKIAGQAVQQEMYKSQEIKKQI